ncbi:MAG: hypothetical protein FJ295_06685 [Planctomycetes bacterium]|nr:hypothetical protein [Planctomycetota bacterium]
MKGPYERLKYDGRRVWECPACQHRERTLGSVTFQFCKCQANEPAAQRRPMHLLEEGFKQYAPRALPLGPNHPKNPEATELVPADPAPPTNPENPEDSG